MKKALIVAAKDIKEAFRSNSTYFFMGVMMLMAFVYFDGLRNAIKSLSEQGASRDVLRLAIQGVIDTTMYTLPLILNMLFSSFLSTYSVIMDKAKRTLESLMATPLSLRQIWVGKSLAITLPSIGATLVISLLVLVLLNRIFVVPAVGSPVIPDVLSVVSGLLIVPVIAFLVAMIVTLLQLVMSNPRIANFAFIALFMAVFFATTLRLAPSWNFSLTYVVVAVFLTMVNLLLARFLTKERVVLSSKG